MNRILVVDDDRMMVRTLSEIVKLAGWTPTVAFSGEEAVTAVERESFDAVLMDVRMGGISGVDAFRRMKVLRPAIRVLLMTAYSAADLVAEAEREGALVVLNKPVDIDELLAMLRNTGGTPQRVLLVDDNADYLSTLSSILETHGFSVARAVTLEDAIVSLEREHPAAVVLDVRLDHVAPADAILAIKRVSPAVALILYSGNGPALEETVAATPRTWVHASLRKPFHPHQLIQLLHGLIAG